MNDRRLLSATFWAMLVVQTIGSVDLPGQGKRKLPSPKQYVAIVVLWSILNLVADAGPGWARLASRLSALVLLTGAVVGPFGARAIGFLQTVTSTFSLAPATANRAGAAASAPAPSTPLGV